MKANVPTIKYRLHCFSGEKPIQASGKLWKAVYRPNGKRRTSFLSRGRIMANAKSLSLIHPVEAAFKKNYPALLPAMKIALAVCIGLVFKEKTKPLSLILENPSGRGKSTVIETLFPVEDKAFAKMTDYVYRSD